MSNRPMCPPMCVVTTIFVGHVHNQEGANVHIVAAIVHLDLLLDESHWISSYLKPHEKQLPCVNRDRHVLCRPYMV